jgi:hypothetical protein
MNGTGYAVNPHFMVLFQKYHLKTIQKYPSTTVIVKMMNNCGMMLKCFMESCNPSSNVQQLVCEDTRPHGFCNGIDMYGKALKTIGLNTQTQIWHLEHDPQCLVDLSVPDGLRTYIQQDCQPMY